MSGFSIVDMESTSILLVAMVVMEVVMLVMLLALLKVWLLVKLLRKKVEEKEIKEVKPVYKLRCDPSIVHLLKAGVHKKKGDDKCPLIPKFSGPCSEMEAADV